MAIKHSITLSTTEPNNEVGVIKIRQADEQTQMLDVQITENGVPKSYQGLAVYFCAKLGQTAGLGIIEQKLKLEEMTNPANGKLEYTMRAEDWQILGRQKGYFSFRKMKDEHEFIEQFTTRDFSFDVIKSVYSDGLKEVKKDGSTYVWTIEDMVRLFDEYIASGKTNWEEFVEQNREILESVDPGGKILGEIILARGGAETLGERLDEDKAEVSAQLAQTTEEIEGKITQAKNKLDNRIDNIVATPTAVTEQEIMDAREGKRSLGANIRSKADNIVLENQIRNGDFSEPVDFETEWNRGSSSETLITEVTPEGQLSVESNLTTVTHYLNSKNLDLRSGDKYYLKYTVSENVGGALVRVQFFDSSNTLLSRSIVHPNIVGTHSVTDVAHDNTSHAQLNFSVTQEGRKIVIDNIVFVNLTKTWGAGNEPTASEVDEYLNKYPNGYIEGGATLLDMRDVNKSLNDIRESLSPSIDKLGDLSKATVYSSSYELEEFNDYYRSINNGPFSMYNYFRQGDLDSIVTGHKYLIDITVRSSPETVRVGFGNSINNSVAVSSSSEFNHVRRIIETVQDYKNFGAYMTIPAVGANGHYIDVKKDAGFYDLTAIFGEGLEPTQSELNDVFSIYPDTKTALLNLLVNESKVLRAELDRFRVLTKVEFNEMRADFAGMLNPIDNTGYYYRGNPAPSILVGNEAVDYETFIDTTWEQLRKEYQDYITRNTIIKDTSESFDIYEYVFEPETYSKTVFLIAGVHGDEYEAFWGLYYFMKKIVEDTDNHDRMVGLKDNIRYVVIPIVNPWGMENQTRRNSKVIDSNANYDVNFGETGYASEGSAPFSENESKAVKMIAEKYDSEIDLFIDFHTDPYSPMKGNYITIVESSILWDTGVQITLDEIDYLNETYNFVTQKRPAIVNVSSGNGAWRYMELIKNVPSLIWETSVGIIAETGTSKMMTIGMDWIINVFTEMLKVE